MLKLFLQCLIHVAIAKDAKAQIFFKYYTLGLDGINF